MSRIADRNHVRRSYLKPESPPSPCLASLRSGQLYHYISLPGLVRVLRRLGLLHIRLCGIAFAPQEVLAGECLRSSVLFCHVNLLRPWFVVRLLHFAHLIHNLLPDCYAGLASVWTVAYAFVPAGHLLRERSDIVSILQLGSIALGFRFPKFRRLKTTVGIAPSARSQIRIIVTSIALSSLLATLYKRPSQLVRPYTSAPGVITTGIWTLHFGLNNLGRDSQRQLQKLIGYLHYIMRSYILEFNNFTGI